MYLFQEDCFDISEHYNHVRFVGGLWTLGYVIAQVRVTFLSPPPLSLSFFSIFL